MASRNPFLIDGPTSISFSGGRTSGYLLWRVLEANGGLPDEACVLFANTGKEMLETLDFVHECGQRWNVPITWIEYRPKKDGDKQYAVVDYETASRNGEPFEAIITDRNYLPNPVTRFCTTEMKIRPMHWYIRETKCWDEWDTMIGIRADEHRRVSKIRARGRSTESSRETMLMPLADAGIGVQEVGKFWASQGFDLRLPNMNGRTMHGNCDLCFLKGGNQILSLIREKPERAVWWAAQEARVRATGTFKGAADKFRTDRPSYAEMMRFAQQQQEMFADEEGLACFCGD